MRIIIFFSFLFVFSGSLFSQENKTQTIDKDSIVKIIILSNKTHGKERDSLLKKAMYLSKKYNYDYLLIDGLTTFTFNGIITNDSIAYKAGLQELLSLYKRKENINALGRYYFLKGDYAKNNNNLDSAYVNFIKAKNIFVAQKDRDFEGIVYNYLLRTFKLSKDRISLELTAVEAEQFLEDNTENYMQLITLNSILGDAIGIYNIRKAEDYFKKAEYFIDSIQDFYSKDMYSIGIKSNLGYMYLENASNNQQKSLKVAKEGIDIFMKSEYKDNVIFIQHQIRLLIILGKSQLQLGKVQEGYAHLQKALSLADKHNIKKNKPWLLNTLASVSENRNQPRVAINHAEEALRLSVKTNNIHQTIEALTLLARLSVGKQSKDYFTEVIHLKDSINNRALKVRESFALIRYETQKKEEENAILKQQNLLNQVKIEKETQKSKVYGLLAIIAVLFGITTYLVFRNRRKVQTYKNNLQKAEAREQERMQIARSLHDKLAGDLRVIYQRAIKMNADEIANPLLKVSQEVRNLSHELSTVNFKEVSFKDQLINLVSDYYAPTFKIKINHLDDINWLLIDKPIKRAFYLVIRESIHNSKKHGLATKVSIDFKKSSNGLKLQIKDNGIGFDVNSPRVGLGLKNIRGRIEELSGFFEVKSHLNKGTTTQIEIPILT